VLGGEHHDRHVADRTNALERLPPVLARHLNVENDEVRRRLLELGDALDAVARSDDLALDLLQQIGDECTDVFLVVDYESQRHPLSLP
jgi:hypothetical protein